MLHRMPINNEDKKYRSARTRLVVWSVVIILTTGVLLWIA